MPKHGRPCKLHSARRAFRIDQLSHTTGETTVLCTSSAIVWDVGTLLYNSMQCAVTMAFANSTVDMRLASWPARFISSLSARFPVARRAYGMRFNLTLIRPAYAFAVVVSFLICRLPDMERLAARLMALHPFQSCFPVQATFESEVLNGNAVLVLPFTHMLPAGPHSSAYRFKLSSGPSSTRCSKARSTNAHQRRLELLEVKYHVQVALLREKITEEIMGLST